AGGGVAAAGGGKAPPPLVGEGPGVAADGWGLLGNGGPRLAPAPPAGGGAPPTPGPRHPLFPRGVSLAFFSPPPFERRSPGRAALRGRLAERRVRSSLSSRALTRSLLSAPALWKRNSRRVGRRNFGRILLKRVAFD